MRKFYHFEQEAGCVKVSPAYPPITKLFYAYKGGVAHGPFKDEASALNVSRNIESVFDPDEMKFYQDAVAENTRKVNHAITLWEKELRKEYHGLSDGVYNLCYSMAYEDAHSDGYDEIARYMDKYADFTFDLKELLNEPL
jgi:hypothetical protein